MKIKARELTGAALDWAVAKCCGMAAEMLTDFENGDWMYGHRKYSSSWGMGGPIIEREHIAIDMHENGTWHASIGRAVVTGGNPLQAAMRCFVASKLGDCVDIPEELCLSTI